VTARFPLCLAVVATLVIGAGACARKPATELQVDGRNYGAFYYWRSSVSSQFTPEQWRDFNESLEEIRLHAMIRGTTGTDAINEALCREVDGLAIAEVLRRADQFRLERLKVNRERLKEMVDGNALLAATPGDAELGRELAARLANQRERLRKLDQDIEAARRRAVAHGAKTDAVLKGRDGPTVLSRESAIRDFARLIETRRANAAFRYGDWPLKIDWSGAELSDEEHAMFVEKRAAARFNGHVVIPVYVRASWRIFDGVVNYPEFTEAVTANLTEKDEQAMRQSWAESEAEIWARKQASGESPETAIAKMKAHVEAVMRQ
jgi:hypothetical protein